LIAHSRYDFGSFRVIAQSALDHYESVQRF